jgi:large subunit ribosomal protein L24
MQKLKKGDTVQIILGKDRGKSGQIERVMPKKSRIVVPGVNIYKRNIKKGLAGAEGGTFEIAKPLNISNVALVCPNCKKLTRVGFQSNGNDKIRICKKCQKEIK